MAKIHMAITPRPFVSGIDQVAFCGEDIPKAEALPLVSTEGIESNSTIYFCKICFGPRYVSFIVSGQEYMDDTNLKFSLAAPRPKPRPTDFPPPESEIA